MSPQLVRRGVRARPEREWELSARRAFDHDSGLLRVLGGPGTGKTTLLAEVAADRILRRDASPENVLVLTAGRRAAATVRTEITRLLTDDAARAGSVHTASEPMVRTVHSYAFAVLRLQAMRAEHPPPRLLSGPEQDTVVRELLAGDVESGAGSWPASLRPALTVPGFAEELRDLLMRAAERGLGPGDLADLGKRHERPEWVAAGAFYEQYEQVTLLSGAGESGAAPALDAAELVGSALLAFDADPGLLAAERERVRYVVVDDAQQLDPQQFRLVESLGSTATEFVVAGDPDQTVFSFRGAEPRGLVEADPTGEHTEVLTLDRRMATPVRAAVRRLISRLPGAGVQRELDGPERDGSVRVRLLASPAQEAAWVADQLRRAHLLEGVPWSEMAVIVRSSALSVPVLRRALLAAGVPVELPSDDVPLAKRTAIRPLLTLLRCAARPEELDGAAADALLSSSLGGADPLALRRLRRGLRRLEVAAGTDRPSSELLVEALHSGDRLTALEASAATPALRVSSLLRTVRESIEAGGSVEETLWQAWVSSGLQERWVSLAERGGVQGRQADRDLDAVMALFDAAARFGDRLPGADVGGFAEHLESQQIAGSSLAPSAPRGDAVSVLTAHASTGREWEVVAIPGVQEGVWPDLRLRGSLLGVERLIDAVSGVEGGVSATAPLLAEERRLLLVAASRARRSLLVSAVRGEDEQPSRFLDELEGVVTEADAAERPLERPERGLVLADLVGELRQVVCDAKEDESRRKRAGRQLARLAEAGIPGAHPNSWYGLAEPSTEASLVSEGDPVRITPSTVDTLSTCPLRWMIERHGGQDAAELASVTGTLVHALVQAAADGADTDALRRALDTAWETVDAGAPWFSRREKARVESMMDSFLSWLTQSRHELTQRGVEHDLDVEVPAREGGPWLRLRGRVDRLESDAQDRPVVVDVKTSKTPVSKNDAEEHPQLAVYQLAAALGAFGESREPGGARLLYVAKPDAKTGAAERGQGGLDEERIAVWLDVVHDAAASSLGPAFVARENADCDRCPARTCCPVHPAGRQVGS
ncbi:ATP-dependent helicase [Allosaccharopolyspora coralli]|uniref:ATP-dependent helicase n=1 Tax=Allosaccharopolyspora coralli TaxID=2665642 RepID=UPI00389919BE